jgi:membrane-bound serine protease (ClpP class)
VAYILLSLGFLGLYFEFANPGAIFPGVMGGICLLLGFYALSILPLNYAGVALILLAVVLFIAEVKITSYGLLTVGGVISLIIGSLMLFKSAGPAFELSLWIVLSVASAIFVATLFLMTLVVRTHTARITTGAEGLVGETGIARDALRPQGKVFVHGEIWHARAEGEVRPGDVVQVTGVEGLRLVVKALESNAESRLEEAT